MESVLEKIASPSQTVLYAVGITALAFLYNFISYFRIWIAAVDLPYVGFEKFSILAFLKARNRANSNDIWEMVQEGYKKYKGEPFRIPTLARNTVYIPPKYFNEIKSLPDDVVSFSAANNDNLEGDYTGIKTDSEELHVFIKLVRAELTQSIAHLMGEIQEEATFSVEEELGDVKSEWTQVPVYAKMLRVVSRTSGRIFVGPNICRDEGWMNECIMYTVNVFSAASALKEISWIRKKLFYWTLPELKTVYRTKKHAIDILKPEIIRRRKAEEEAKARGEEWKDRPDDFLEWYRQATIDHPRFSKIDYQAWLQLQLSMAAIHTTSITTTHIIYDIAAHPEFVDELREEAMKVVAQYGGKLTKMGMGKLSKLDSFMKESQRVNTLSVSSISRQVVARKGITLSNGLHLPYGTRIHTPQNEIYQDPAVFKDADKFDPWRFHRLRQTPNNEVAGQFVTTSSEFASFGHGKHACPGRFFAAAEVKGFITILLSRFEWRLPEGQMERPQNFRRVAGQMPNPMAMIEFRRRPEHEIFL